MGDSYRHCFQCGNPIQNGEVVRLKRVENSELAYHHILEEFCQGNRQKDCGLRYVNGYITAEEKFGFSSPAVFYKGRLYDWDRIIKLSDKTRITITRNGDGNSTFVQGNLDLLLKEKPLNGKILAKGLNPFSHIKDNLF